jgi:hypothetical protein
MNACNHHAMRRASIEFTLIALRLGGHELCILNLPPGCDNMVNQLAKSQGVGISLFLTMVFFETSRRLNYLCTIIQVNAEFSYLTGGIC